MIRRLELHNKRSGLFEGLNYRLFESDTRIKRTERIIEDNFNGILNPDGKVSGPDYYINNNQDTTWRQYLLYNLRHTFSLMSNSDVPYLPGVATIAYRDCRFDKLDQDLDKINKLTKYISLAKKEGKLITADMTFDGLAKEYEPVLKREEEEENEKRKELRLSRNERYKIIRINDFETAKKYGKYTGGKNGKSKLCYTEDEYTWENFTYSGNNACYLCLRDDFESVKPVKTEGYPKDSYGLSMVWVFVNPCGRIRNSNVRWNHGDHSYNNVDSMFTKMELEELLGLRFEDVFRPNDSFEKTLEEAKLRLENRERIEDVFDDAWDFSEGYARVRLGGLWNFISKDGKLLSERWFDTAWNFSEGYAAVELDRKYNFIGKDGKFLSERWFDGIGDFSEGYAKVYLDGKCNFIGKDGKLLFERWFDCAWDFSEGYARVQLDHKWNFIGKDGELLSERWFEYAGDFSEGYAAICLDNKWNFIGKDGELLSERWFDGAIYFSEGYAVVKLDGKWNFIGKDGELLSERWFDSVERFREDYASVEINGGYFKIDKAGNIF